MLRDVFLLGVIASATGWGASVSILNPSFESPAQAAGGFTFDAGDNWNVTGFGGVWRPSTGPNNGSNFFASLPAGSQVLFEGFGTSSDASQNLGISLLPNEIYTLTYYVGQRYDVPLSSYQVALKAGAVVLASDSGGAPTAGNFLQRTFSFTTGNSPIAGNLIIDISSTGFAATGGSGQAAFDLITLDASPVITSVPEPATFFLIGIGAAVVARSRRHFSRN
jgi:hypothetical protein